MERPPVGVGAREGRRAWSPVGGQEGVGVTAQQGVSHPSWLGWWGWGDDAQRPLGGEACLWSRAPRNWAGLGHPAQAWGSTWEPQRGRYCQELAPVSPTATRGAPSLAGGVAVCPWRAGHGAAWSPVQGGEALASCGGAGSRALGPHWVEGPVCGGWRCGGAVAWSCGVPLFQGSIWEPLGAGSCLSTPSPGGAGCCAEGARPQAGRSPFVCSGCVFPPLPREGAASHRSGSHRCVDHRPPGPRQLCALGAGGSPGRPLLHHCLPPRGRPGPAQRPCIWTCSGPGGDAACGRQVGWDCATQGLTPQSA